MDLHIQTSQKRMKLKWKNKNSEEMVRNDFLSFFFGFTFNVNILMLLLSLFISPNVFAFIFVTILLIHLVPNDTNTINEMLNTLFWVLM